MVVLVTVQKQARTGSAGEESTFEAEDCQRAKLILLPAPKDIVFVANLCRILDCTDSGYTVCEETFFTKGPPERSGLSLSCVQRRSYTQRADPKILGKRPAQGTDRVETYPFGAATAVKTFESKSASVNRVLGVQYGHSPALRAYMASKIP